MAYPNTISILNVQVSSNLNSQQFIYESGLVGLRKTTIIIKCIILANHSPMFIYLMGSVPGALVPARIPKTLSPTVWPIGWARCVEGMQPGIGGDA